MIDPAGPPRMSTLAIERLEISLKISRSGFFRLLRGSICEGASLSCSMCFPGRDMILGASNEPNPAADTWQRQLKIQAIVEIDIQDWEVLGMPFATVAATEGFLAPQVAAAGAWGFGPLPRAGNNSSDRTSKAGVFFGAAWAGGEGDVVSAVDGAGGAGRGRSSFTEKDGGGCFRSSSSTTSSTVTLWALSWACCSSSMAARDLEPPPLTLALGVSEAMTTDIDWVIPG